MILSQQFDYRPKSITTITSRNGSLYDDPTTIGRSIPLLAKPIISIPFPHSRHHHRCHHRHINTINASPISHGGDNVNAEYKISNESPPEKQEGKKSFWGAVSLIIGTAVGPGMLGLPSATMKAGPLPSTISILISWVYVISSIILIAELSFATMEEDDVSEVSFTTLATKAFGTRFGAFVALIYASLSFSLLIACVSGIGSIVSQLIPSEARKAILVGGIVPLIMVSSWNIIVLGLAKVGTNTMSDPISILLSVNPFALFAVQAFAFSALATSLIGYAVSFPKQLLDTLDLIFRNKTYTKYNKNDTFKLFVTTPLVLSIPVLIATQFRSTFSKALDFAAVYANCFLFGLLPPVMTYIYQSRKTLRYYFWSL